MPEKWRARIEAAQQEEVCEPYPVMLGEDHVVEEGVGKIPVGYVVKILYIITSFSKMR